MTKTPETILPSVLKKRVPSIITGSWLKEQGAYNPQLQMFIEEWPKGASITPDNIHRAVVLGLDTSCLTRHLLAPPALEVYQEAVDQGWKVYQEAKAQALILALWG